ncbi:Aste57867_16491 [Aphanomyces stellatus]|uniref:Aste57867_16491 protein n=1 Tax=Aphanomyces stellatus TaxID=120398 RepID=A0A485L6T5_9STRA|nr:hypothetical protein As57867_016434 [Aphanomyces stellatus]VFT93265.1 Aste57867_16491 [Aphanomyces stellatus]
MLVYDVKHLFVLLCLVNILVYINRGIIPGAPIQFQAFVEQGSGNVDHINLYIGLLAALFIAAYSLAMCVFGFLAMRHRPFVLAATGLFLWIVALAICGLAKPLKSYGLLVAGRILCGIGEAAFQAVVPSFINEFAPLEKRTFWLGLFGGAISVGTAVGFSYGSLLAKYVGWDWGFYIAAVVMFPFVFLCYRCIPDLYNMPLAHKVAAEPSLRRVSMDSLPDVGFLSETWAILRSPFFLAASLGWAAFSFTIVSLATFGPAILIGVGVLSEDSCATVFGAITVVAGMCGSPLGGYLVDLQCRRREDDHAFRLYVATRQLLVLIVTGTLIALVSVVVIDIPALFLTCIFVALVLLFMTTSPFTVVILLSVTRARQGFAIGLSTLILHALGDVPSPIILGYLKDQWAPHCNSIIEIGRPDRLNPDCAKLDHDGLRNLLWLAFAWLGLAVLTWGAAYIMARRKLIHQEPKLTILYESSRSTPVGPYY